MTPIERLRANRKIDVSAGKFVFKARRPTADELSELQGIERGEVLRKFAEFVEGWENVTANDLFPGDPAESIEFEWALFWEWLRDRPDLWDDLIEGIWNAHLAYEEALSATGKP